HGRRPQRGGGRDPLGHRQRPRRPCRGAVAPLRALLLDQADRHRARPGHCAPCGRGPRWGDRRRPRGGRGSDLPRDPPARGNAMRGRILVVDDERAIGIAIQRLLGARGHEVDAVLSGREALARLAEHAYHLVITDLSLQDVSGMDVLRWVREHAPETAAVMITAFGSAKIAVEAMKLAAADYIPKPFDNDERELVESELFGHEKGAFTGAVTAREGKFEIADGGTLFLDEIGDMPLETQAKILRVLQERELERVGGNRTLKVDVRILAATNQDLE